ncbi:MAG TPA: low temperature requirement protein A [Acetobacteraceae bacterium]|nr:low temperature requirement protein A [Acetobacteraceae bacterium]
MAALSARTVLLRRRGGGAERSPVTNIELFFDLVFAFAITQVSHSLLTHLSLLGALHAALLFVAVWWVWIDTSWVTNWLDPDRTPVRMLLFALMLAGLVLSASLPEAFGERGLAFAGAYVFMQVGRSLFMLWALHRHDRGNFRNFQRITVWMAGAGVFWLLGGVLDGAPRFGLWLLALTLEFGSPAIGFHVPGLGRSTTADWTIDGGHLAERCSAFILIALGESITVTGASFFELTWTATAATAFVAAFVGSVALWWIYFDIGAERASRIIALSDDPGRLGRIAYTYILAVLAAGIVVSAVGDELTLAHPTAPVGGAAAAVLLGGPLLALAGNIAFKRVTAGRVPLSHLVGLAILAALLPCLPWLNLLRLDAASAAALVVVATWERMSLGAAGREAPAVRR